MLYRFRSKYVERWFNNKETPVLIPVEIFVTEMSLLFSNA